MTAELGSFITLEPKNPAFRQHGKIFLNYVVDEAV